MTIPRWIRERFYRRLRACEMPPRASLVVHIDPDAVALIESAATAMHEAGLHDQIDDMVARGVFKESMQSTLRNGILVVTIGPFTELLLRECLDVARRPGWSRDLRARWIDQAVRVAGFD